MEYLKRTLSLILVFSLTTQGVFAAEAVQTTIVNGEEVETPQNPPGTPEGVTCTDIGSKPGANGVCCQGLVTNVGGFCDEPAFVDDSLKSCTENSECGTGMACLPQTTATLFMRLAPTTEPVEDIKEQRKHFTAQIDDIESPKKEGELCYHPKECKSYSCVDNKCEDKKVCRMAAEGEVAQSGVKCGPDLERNANGVCELSAEAKNTVYIGLLKESTISPVGQCQFELDEKTRERSIVAMRSLRAMEWFFSTISLDYQEECFQVMPLLKHEVGGVVYESRKQILRNFTDVLNQIENDYAQVIAASEKYKSSVQSNGGVEGSTKELSVHGEPVTEADLGSRITSGYDTLMLMYRRNLLFQSYEKAMLDTMNLVSPKVAGLSTNMKDWNDGDTQWNIGTRVVPAYNCEGSKYKKKKLWRWRTKYYHAVKDRWTNYYQVTGNAEANAKIVKREEVSKVLGLLSGYEEKSDKATQEEVVNAAIKKAITEFTTPNYYLIDPLLFAGMRHGQYGQAKSLASKSGFLGFSGFKDLRKAYYIKGDSVGSYERIHNDLKLKVRDYYRTLKNTKEQKKFVYEPELVTTSAKDCLDNDKSEKCTEFETFLDGVVDETFAHFLAYSYHDRDSYSNFFRNATTYRRKLLAKLEVDIQNISTYYDTVLKHRNEQNKCIEKVMNGLVDSGILADSSGGIQEGKYNNTKKGISGNLTGNAASRKTTMAKFGPATRSKFMFNLRDTSLKNLSDSSILDNVSGIGSSSERGDVNSGASALLALRADAMNRANQKAAAAGVNVAGKDKAGSGLMSKIASASGLGKGLSTSGNSSSRSGFGSNPFGSASVSKTPLDQSQGPTGEGIKGGEEIKVGDTKGAGANTSEGGLGIKDNYNATGEGSGDNATNLQQGKDATGLSDEERDRLLSEAERNKKDYQGQEEDGIFSKVSKAYVRNLDKVLIRKKKID